MEDITMEQYQSLHQSILADGLIDARAPHRSTLRAMRGICPHCSDEELFVAPSASVNGAPVHKDDVVFITFEGSRCAGTILLLFQAGLHPYAVVSVWLPCNVGNHDLHVAEFRQAYNPQFFPLHDIGSPLIYTCTSVGTVRVLVPLQYR